MKLSERLDHMEQHHLDEGDEYGAEVLHRANERINQLKDGIKMAHLHLLASVCECGEPLKETDAFDVLDALLTGDDDETE